MTLRSALGRLRRRLLPRPAPLILMYHRVAEVQVDPWDLAVHPDRFAAQLAVLRETRRPFATSEFVERSRAGTLPRNAVAVTFDDGYADNLRQARPRLAAAGVPATLFLTTASVGQDVEYWWDELARGILQRNDALDEAVVVAGAVWRLRLDAVADAAADSSSWRALTAPRTERQQLYSMLCERLKNLRAPQRDEAMRALRAALRTPAPHPDDLPMTGAQVRELAGDGLFEIGGHTDSHPLLPALTHAERRRDILDGKRICERLTGRPAIGFAYPHGVNDADSRAAVAECGFRWACTTQPIPVSAAADPYALPRIRIGDWDASTFAAALEGASA